MDSMQNSLPAPTLDWFDTPYYYLLYQNRNYEEATRFIDTLFVENILQADDYILDLACGKGRHARVMRDHGARVLGVDAAVKAIEEATKYADSGLHFAVHDMRLPLTNGPFSAVTNLFTSFGYFSDEENATILHNVYKATVQGGTFVLDYLNADLSSHQLVPKEEVVIENFLFIIHRQVKYKAFIKDISVYDRQTGDCRGHYTEVVHAYTRQQLKEMVQEAGFIVEKEFGDYSLRQESQAQASYGPRVILVCRKT